MALHYIIINTSSGFVAGAEYAYFCTAETLIGRSIFGTDLTKNGLLW